MSLSWASKILLGHWLYRLACTVSKDFFGSPLQTAYPRHVQRQDVIDSKGQLVLIHAINPFGFFALRRVNEDNVDLNRNFLVTGETYSGSSQLYKDLNGFLNPASPPHQFDGYL